MSKPQSDSGARRSALFLSPEAPYPMVGGGALRSASVFEYLAARYDVDVITFRQPGGPDPRTAFPRGAARDVQVIDLPLHSGSRAARILRNVNRALRGRPPLLDRFSGFGSDLTRLMGGKVYDLGIIEHFWCAPYEAQLRPACRRLLLNMHNVESEWHATLAASENAATAVLHRRFQFRYRILERGLLPRFDHLMVTSRGDSERICQIAPGVRPAVYPNALPTTPRPPRVERDAIVFTGNLEYRPNRLAIRYFKDRIWPSVKQGAPRLIWEIIGKNAGAIREIVAGDPAIQVVGSVDDAITRIAGAKAAIVPILAGSGTRIKILEAWAAAAPVVSTSLGAAGLECRAGEHLLIADTPADFSAAILRLYASPSRRQQIGDAGRLQYESLYTWPSAWTILDGLLGETVSPAKHPNFVHVEPLTGES